MDWEPVGIAERPRSRVILDRVIERGGCILAGCSCYALIGAGLVLFLGFQPKTTLLWMAAVILLPVLWIAMEVLGELIASPVHALLDLGAEPKDQSEISEERILDGLIAIALWLAALALLVWLGSLVIDWIR
jgi:hypothetical protein